MAKNIKYSVLGVMSGTSLDGLDLAICTFNKRNNWEFKIEKSETIRYTNYWNSKLVNLPFQNKELISKTDIEYGTFLGEKINTFLEGKEVDLFKDESVTLTQSLQDVKDIEKVFTDFSRTFSVPASRENNKIFGHF